VERNNHVATYLTDEELAELDGWADATDKSRSTLLREAIREYLDHDRNARVEDRLDDIEAQLGEIAAAVDTDTTHTHTPQTGMNQTASPAVERARQIVRRLQSNHDEVVKEDAVDRAIEDIAGLDDRTLRKYKGLFRKRGLLFEHPGEPPLWALNKSLWFDWMRDYLRLNGKDEAESVADDYPAQIIEDARGEGYRIELADSENIS